MLDSVGYIEDVVNGFESVSALTYTLTGITINSNPIIPLTYSSETINISTVNWVPATTLDGTVYTNVYDFVSSIISTYNLTGYSSSLITTPNFIGLDRTAISITYPCGDTFIFNIVIYGSQVGTSNQLYMGEYNYTNNGYSFLTPNMYSVYQDSECLS
jgi:hypothetical protein